MIPAANPGAAYRAHQAEIDAAIRRVSTSGRYILGPEVEAFEAEFAAYIGVKYCVGVGSGTDALQLAIQAALPESSRQAVTVSMSATATVAAIAASGRRPILLDIYSDDYTMDIGTAADVRTESGLCIVPVHLYGRPCRMDVIMRWAAARQAVVIEDCAQAHGAMWREQRVGSIGAAAAFSFYPTKNLGALGDGGALVTNSAEIAERARLLAMYGWRRRYIADGPGGNSRLDELQAAILRVKLRYLDAETARRVEIAETYNAAFADLGVTLPPTGGVYHQYVIQHPRRDALRQRLADKGVETAVLYPVPIHLQPAYADEPPLHLPVTEQLCRNLLCVPMYPGLSEREVTTICTAMRQAVDQV